MQETLQVHLKEWYENTGRKLVVHFEELMFVEINWK